MDYIEEQLDARFEFVHILSAGTTAAGSAKSQFAQRDGDGGCNGNFPGLVFHAVFLCLMRSMIRTNVMNALKNRKASDIAQRSRKMSTNPGDGEIREDSSTTSKLCAHAYRGEDADG